MDAIDLQILKCLRENSRINASVIGEGVDNNPHVIEYHYITGDFDFLLKIMTESIDALTRTLNDIKGITGVSLTRTLIVLSTSKSDYCVLPDSMSLA